MKKNKNILKINESDLKRIVNVLLQEATTKTQTVKTTDYTSSEVADMMKKGEGVNVSNGEVTPTQGGGIRVLQKAGKSESPKDKVIKDGEMSEGKKKKKSKYNPWAICTAQLGKEFKTTERSEWSAKQKNKYERCVKQVKQDVNEGKNPYMTILESKFENLIKNNIQGRITKKNFVSLLETKSKDMETTINLIGKPKMNKPIGRIIYGKSEMSETETAPAKPKVKPGTETRPKPSHPGKNPKPGEGPAPAKAKKIETKEVSNSQMQRKKDEFMSAINKILKK
jgi:hypothetical protein